MPRSNDRDPRRPAATGRRYLRKNLTTWDRTAAEYERRHRRALERVGGKAWGLFRIPERRLRLLGPVRGKRVLELGCGAADWSIALARDGARVVGLDFSEVRLAQARENLARTPARVTLVHAPAESIPYPAESFDIVLSDYGATTFSDPTRTVPEVARVLRPGGLFVFAHASPFRSVTESFASNRLLRTMERDYFGLRALRTSDAVEFQLPYSDWIRLFVSNGFVVDRLIEPVAPASPRSTYLHAADQRWAHRWPVESIWRLVMGRPPSRPIGRDRL